MGSGVQGALQSPHWPQEQPEASKVQPAVYKGAGCVACTSVLPGAWGALGEEGRGHVGMHGGAGELLDAGSGKGAPAL